MEKIFKKECFAYCEKNGKPYCNALTECECKDCRFFTEKSKVKNNPYYAFSYEDKAEHLKEVKEKKIKEECVIWK